MRGDNRNPLSTKKYISHDSHTQQRGNENIEYVVGDKAN